MTHWVIATGLLMAASAAAATSPYLWQNRVIVVRADAADNTKFVQQRRVLVADLDALRERDVVVFAVFENGAIQSIFGPVLTASVAKPLADILIESKDFQIALIGKDGGIKLKATDPVSLEQLVNLIDAMPMRRQEKRND